MFACMHIVPPPISLCRSVLHCLTCSTLPHLFYTASPVLHCLTCSTLPHLFYTASPVLHCLTCSTLPHLFYTASPVLPHLLAINWAWHGISILNQHSHHCIHCAVSSKTSNLKVCHLILDKEFSLELIGHCSWVHHCLK